MGAAPALIVLAKPPRRGAAKSRLAATLGPGAAARLARAMFFDSLATLRDELPGAPRLLALSDAPSAYPTLPDPPDAVLHQGDGDLGRRMARCLARTLDAHAGAVLLGTDAPARPDGHLRAVAASLATHDLVLGACRDGGFWCLAGRASAAILRDETWLDELAWERADTAAQVRARANARGLSLAEAPAWFDLDEADDLAHFAAEVPETRAPRLHALLREDPTRDPLSIVLPTLDEGARLLATLDALAEQPGPLELIVADGGSRDDAARQLPRRAELTVVDAPRGRGSQLAAGCALATGDALLVLHVDTRLPPGATELVRQTLATGEFEAGAFVIRTEAEPGRPNFAGPLLRLADLRSRWTAHPYGDQAMFFSARAYAEAGGFRPLPIMEDYDLSRRLAARRPLARLRPAVRVSGRRIQARPLRSLLLMRLLPPLFRLGVSPERLAQLYNGGRAAPPNPA